MATYKEAEKWLKEYLTGSLAQQLEIRKLELKYPPRRSSVEDLRNKAPDPKVYTGGVSNPTEQAVLKYVEDGTYTFLKTYHGLIGKCLEFFEQTDVTAYKVVVLYYGRDYIWKEVSAEVNLSESQCKRKRRKVINELKGWL